MRMPCNGLTKFEASSRDGTRLASGFATSSELLVYRFFYWLILSRLPAEWTHHVAFGALRLLMAVPGIKALGRKLLAPHSESLAVEALGMRFPSPLGLAAGFDKDARGIDALGALGFGFIEIGTITGQAQSGNAKPRMFRLVRDRALINRMGFNNRGSEVAAERLSRRRRSQGPIVGVNIGKTKVVAEEDAIGDYVLSAERLGPMADYMVVNVSSPNTPGLRNLQAVELLRPLLRAVRETLDRVCPERHVPLLVKIAPDLANDDVDAVADLALELKLDGIIATNTTISREGLQTAEARVKVLGAGGLSGAPLKKRSTEVIRRLKSRVGDNLILIAAGGIESGEDAYERLQAGATLVQAYTGFVYGGPFWPKQVTRALQKKLGA
jgi:dihydroorotate dehydrogenase